MQICLDCGLNLPLVKFGHKIGGCALSCSVCDRARRTNPIHKKRYSQFLHCRERAKAKGLEFTITMQDLVWVSHCPVLGIKLSHAGGVAGRDNSPSIDRLDNAQGYIPGNVEIISNKANRMKSDASAEELLNFAKYYIDKLN